MTRRRRGGGGGGRGPPLLVVTGKGGVGKTVLAAALGRLLARSGRRTLVLEVDPREQLHHLFDTHPSGGAIVDVGDDLWHQNLDPRTVIDALVTARVPLAVIRKAVLRSPIYHHFVEGAPGLRSLAILGHALRLVEGEAGPGVDVVVLDAPATGHGLSLLAAPQLVTDVVPGGPVGRLASEIADLTTDPERSAIVVATLAEEMPVQEAIELIALLDERVGRRPGLVVVNGLYPEVPRPRARADPIPALWRRRREANEAERSRLAERWAGPSVDVPLFPVDDGPELVRRVADRLTPAVARLEHPA